MTQSPADSRAWFRQLNGYHWLVLVVCTMAWAFDCLSQQIFNLTRKPAMDALTGSQAMADFFGPLSTTALLVGWATGGIIFGVLGDRIGRAKTLTIMILCYSASTGLCGLSVTAWDYVFYCFLTGMGAGGIFPIACTLVAESLPDQTRPQALGAVQTFSAVGNVSAGLISLGMVALLAAGVISTHWRWMFSIGIVPALLAVIVASKLREPDVWKRAIANKSLKKASLRELFAEPRWRRNAIVGLLLAASGVVGLWGIGVFSYDLTQGFIGVQYDETQRQAGEPAKDLQFVSLALASPESFAAATQGRIFDRQLLGETAKDADARTLYKTAMELAKEKKEVSAETVLAQLKTPAKGEKTLAAADLARMAAILAQTPQGTLQEHIARITIRQKDRNIAVLQWAAITLICFNIGAFFGMYAFAKVAQRLNRRTTFAVFFLIAMFSTALAFSCMSKMPRDLWMVALMGGAQLSVFGGYAIYFPELFPTRLRSTGTSFCYNVGRYVSAIGGPLMLGLLKPYLTAELGDSVTAARYAGVVMCSCYFVGLAALLFAPETKGKPLPE
jgi:MFS family permease